MAQYGTLVVARHHESEWNKLGKWTGKADVHLSPWGREESEKMGALIKDFHFDFLFISKLVRAKETAELILKNHPDREVMRVIEAIELNERDYGDYTGKDKWEMKELLGEEKWNRVRRGWDEEVPNGESLEMVYQRTTPYFLENILPLILEGKNVLLVAHGNSLRPLLKYIENISDQDIEKVEINFGVFFAYELGGEGKMVNKREIKL